MTDITSLVAQRVVTITVAPSAVPVYACVGFEPPFDGAIALKSRMQRAIPLKIQLFTSDGTPITDLNIEGAPPVVNVGHSAGEGTAAVDVTSQLEPLGQSSAGNAFRFEPDAGHWTFNLGTNPFAAPGTYTVTVSPGDTNYLIDPACTGQFVRSG